MLIKLLLKLAPSILKVWKGMDGKKTWTGLVGVGVGTGLLFVPTMQGEGILTIITSVPVLATGVGHKIQKWWKNRKERKVVNG